MKIKDYVAVSYLCGIVAAVLHFIQYNFFYDGKYFLFSGIFSVFAIAVCTIPFFIGLMFYFKNKFICYEYSDTPNRFSGVVTLIASLCTGYSAYVFYQNKSNFEKVTAVGFSVEYPFLLLTSILSVYLFFCAIIQFCKKTEIFAKYKVLELIPVAWGIMLVVYAFIHHSMSILVQENVFIIFMSCTIVVSLMSKARLFSSIDDEQKSFKRMLLFSGVSVSLSIAYFLSNITLTFFTNIKYVALPVELQVICMILSSSIIFFLVFSRFEKVHLYSKPQRFNKKH